MAYTEDMTEFYGDDDPGVVSALWNGTAAVLGQFARGYTDPLLLGVESTDPFFNCPASSVSGVKHGDTLVIAGTTYKVRGVQPDETQMEVNLKLEVQ